MNSTHKRSLLWACLLLFAPWFVESVSGQVIFQSGLDDGTNWLTQSTSDDTSFEFGFDYSTMGIPAAPNGSDTIGLRMEANNNDANAATEAIVAYPDGFSVGGKYRVQADIWINYNTSGGTTEFAGVGVGYDGSDLASAPGVTGASMIFDSDGDSGRDYRLYKNGSEQFVDSGQYSVPENDNSAPEFADVFPGVDIVTAAPGQGLTGTTPNGSGGFRWMTLTVDVDTTAIGMGTTNDPGTATFSLLDSVTGNSVEIGTIDNSNGGDVVSMDGNIALVFSDLFTSVSTRPEFSFGVFDNVVVTQIPEPSTWALLLIACGAWLFMKRR